MEKLVEIIVMFLFVAEINGICEKSKKDHATDANVCCFCRLNDTILLQNNDTKFCNSTSHDFNGFYWAQNIIQHNCTNSTIETLQYWKELKPCHSSNCLKCGGPSKNQCLECKNGFYRNDYNAILQEKTTETSVEMSTVVGTQITTTNRNTMTGSNEMLTETTGSSEIILSTTTRPSDMTFSCVSKCPNGSYHDNLTASMKCVEVCPNGSYHDNLTASMKCVEVCPNGSYHDNLTASMECVEVCPNGSYHDNLTASMKCVENCSSESYHNVGLMKCVSKCPKDRYILEVNNSCVVECPKKYYYVNSDDEKLCLNNTCQDIKDIKNNKCYSSEKCNIHEAEDGYGSKKCDCDTETEFVEINSNCILKSVLLGVGLGVGSLLLIIIMIVLIVCVVRRRSTPNVEQGLSVEMQRKKNESDDAKLVNPGISSPVPDYQNVEIDRNRTLQIRNQHDKVFRYTPDPVANIEKNRVIPSEMASINHGFQSEADQFGNEYASMDGIKHNTDGSINNHNEHGYGDVDDDQNLYGNLNPKEREKYGRSLKLNSVDNDLPDFPAPPVPLEDNEQFGQDYGNVDFPVAMVTNETDFGQTYGNVAGEDFGQTYGNVSGNQNGRNQTFSAKHLQNQNHNQTAADCEFGQVYGNIDENQDYGQNHGNVQVSPVVDSRRRPSAQEQSQSEDEDFNQIYENHEPVEDPIYQNVKSFKK